ncbi:glycosyltransferase family 2 protein [Pseudovibrio ascidiaceicola]|nr:glycosyltransferase family A protein [Pseudovibrio ascidiaceicola]
MLKPQKLAIAVCTRSRENMLLRCVESLGQLIPHQYFEITIVVCDNNNQPMAAELLTSIQAAAQHPVEYVHEAKAGIPFARNAALQTARSLTPNWIAFVDDDEVLDPNWLVEMAEAIQNWPAEIYHGWTQSTPEDLDAPWAFHRPKNKRASGAVMATAGTDNVLFSTKAVDGLMFDEALRFSGGEDLDFFYRATDRGAKIIWVPTAIARESTPLSRLSFQYQVRRAYSVANVQAYISRKRLGARRAITKTTPKAFGRLLGGIAGTLGSSFMLLVNQHRGRQMLLSSAKKVASSIGLLRGVNMKLGNIYQKIDGS